MEEAPTVWTWRRLNFQLRQILLGNTLWRLRRSRFRSVGPFARGYGRVTLLASRGVYKVSSLDPDELVSNNELTT